LPLGASLIVCAPAVGADNCSGYDVLFAVTEETLDLGGGHSLTVFRQKSVLVIETALYNLATGECLGTALATPDGRMRVNGHCARRDKDGDTHSIEFSQAAGAEKGVWKSTGGTGKFAGKNDSGWYQDVRTDGKMMVSKWGGPAGSADALTE
jgi:hypothetical protein